MLSHQENQSFIISQFLSDGYELRVLMLSSHLRQDPARLRGHHVFSRLESPDISVDEQKCGSIELASFEEVMRGPCIQMRQSTSITASVGIDYLAIQFLKRLLCM
jgi:hypothetical protein